MASSTRLKTEQQIYQFLRSIVGLFLRRFVKIEVLGLENVPKEGAAVLVCNHRSDIDPAVIGTAIPRYISWVAADYMRHVPVTSWLIQKTGMVLMAVDGQVSPSSVKQAHKVLKSGQLLGIFPEGEVYIFANDFSAPLAEFQPGFAVLAAQAQVPIIPIVIRPLQEKLKPIRIPPQIRPHIARLHDLSTIRQIPHYQSVQVVIGQPISPEWSQFQNRRESVDWLLKETRRVMMA